MQGPDFNIPMESLMKVQNSRIVLKQAKSRDEYMKRPQVLDGERNAIRRVSELIIIESKQEDESANEGQSTPVQRRRPRNSLPFQIFDMECR